jgi:DNA-3-methyladenine glycosylase
MTGRILARSFYARPAIDVARDLLGKVLWHGETAGIIVETEAYLGGDDLAAHSAAGITPRTRVIFGPPGHAYVYLSYGIHECLNVVAERVGDPGCILIRALEPVAGIEQMHQRRPGITEVRDLARGPGRLTQALAITRRQNGADLTRGDLLIRMPPHRGPIEIEVSPRIGITRCVDWPLRFTIRGNRFVSGKLKR